MHELSYVRLEASQNYKKIALSMWAAANARIMHRLSNTGKLSSPAQIVDYLSYTVKVAELLAFLTFASVVIYDNE